MKLGTLVFMLTLAGCVSSLNQLYTEEDVVFDATLIGVWIDKIPKKPGN